MRKNATSCAQKESSSERKKSGWIKAKVSGKERDRRKKTESKVSKPKKEAEMIINRIVRRHAERCFCQKKGGGRGKGGSGGKAKKRNPPKEETPTIA